MTWQLSFSCWIFLFFSSAPPPLLPATCSDMVDFSVMKQLVIVLKKNVVGF